MSQTYELVNYSSPVSVRIGEEFMILITTENSFRPEQQVVCVRETGFEMVGNIFDMPLTGPESLSYTNGSFAFRGLKFEGNMVTSSPWHTTDTPAKPLWHIKFHLKVNGQIVASATSSIEINI